MSSQLVWFATSKLCRRAGVPTTLTRTPIIQAAAARKREGQRERPDSALVRRWAGPRIANRPMSPAIRKPARALRRAPPDLSIAVERDAVQLHAMVDEPEAEFLGDTFLKRFKFIVDELDYVAGFHVDQMIVMRFRRSFIT